MATPLIAPPSQDFLQKTLSAQLLEGVTASASLNNVTGVQNLKGVFVVDRVDTNGEETPSKREVISFTGTSGSTVITLSRGLAGTTDQDHAVGAIVEFVPDVIWAQSIYENLSEVLTPSTGAINSAKVPAISGGYATTLTTTGATNVTLPTSGTLATQSAIQNSGYVYAADAGSNDSYAITLSPAPSAYATGQVFHFKANTANTGAATLNVNSLGAKTIKKNNDQDLANNDIESGQIVTVVYDGTNFQMQSQVANASTALTSKVGSFTRDMTAATGSVAYTGVGFTPTSIHFSAVIGGGLVTSEGFVDSSRNAVGRYSFSTTGSGANSDLGADTAIALVTAVSNYQQGVVSSYDADGFTISWTKGATPTGTATINYIAYK